MNAFEIPILDFIQKYFRCAFLDWFMPLITRLGDGGILWIALAVLFMILPRYRKMGFMMAIALILGLMVGNLTLKPLIGRMRPYDYNSGFELLIEGLSDYSFPSGHTLASFEGAVVILLNNKKLGIPALILAIFIAFSRLYLYVHYPSDVLAGALLGTLFAFLSVGFINYLSKKQRK